MNEIKTKDRMKINRKSILQMIAAALLIIALASTASVEAKGEVPDKHYHCAMFIVDHLVDTAPFTITGNSTYTDSKDAKNTYSFDSASSTLTFHGGNYDGQRAQYGTKTKHLHILGPSGRRVIECD
jgi:hypothetical protein